MRPNAPIKVFPHLLPCRQNLGYVGKKDTATRIGKQVGL